MPNYGNMLYKNYIFAPEFIDIESLWQQDTDIGKSR